MSGVCAVFFFLSDFIENDLNFYYYFNSKLWLLEGEVYVKLCDYGVKFGSLFLKIWFLSVKL